MFRFYAVLALAKGVNVNSEDVHNAWSAWMAGIEHQHASIRPYDQLPVDLRRDVLPFVSAIRQVAEGL